MPLKQMFMSTLKQNTANRLNAIHSSGPRSDAGKRRSSVNALKHGLTVSIDRSPWGSKVNELGLVLQGDGLSEVEANDLARKILDYERNLSVQRSMRLVIYTIRGSTGIDQVPGFEFWSDSAMRVPDAVSKRQTQPEILEYLEWQQSMKLEGSSRPGSAAQKIKSQINADRHLRRAANQLIREIKR